MQLLLIHGYFKNANRLIQKKKIVTALSVMVFNTRKSYYCTIENNSLKRIIYAEKLIIQLLNSIMRIFFKEQDYVLLFILILFF